MTLMAMEDYLGFRVVARDPELSRETALRLMRQYAELATGTRLPVTGDHARPDRGRDAGGPRRDQPGGRCCIRGRAVRRGRHRRRVVREVRGGRVILCAAARPTVRGLTRRAWGSAVALAATLAVMNFCFYLAIARIPLGIAVTIEALGPLILSVVTSSRRIAWLWALLAFSGVALLGLPRHGGGHFDPMGFAFAAAAGLAWACYILASARTAAEFRRVDGWPSPRPWARSSWPRSRRLRCTWTRCTGMCSGSAPPSGCCRR